MGYKQLVKAAILRGVRYSGAEWLRDRVWAARGTLPAVIVVFHRVTDEIPEDGLTVSTARFREWVRMLRREYHPIGLGTLLDHLEQGRPWPPRTLVVTFDDGYLDNFAFAAPILAEEQVPATFFITAGAIGTERVMFWDEHLRGRVPWMQWEHVRELRRQGFEIGSHTVNHADLGRIPADEAWEELTGAKRRLEDELGEAVDLFAYPFGRRENITEENRALVRRAGYRCCCSGFGGFVTLAADRYDLWRLPLNNWFETSDVLNFELRAAAPWRWLRPGAAPPVANHYGHTGGH